MVYTNVSAENTTSIFRNDVIDINSSSFLWIETSSSPPSGDEL
jgi:hypothetical protein